MQFCTKFCFSTFRRYIYQLVNAPYELLDGPLKGTKGSIGEHQGFEWFYIKGEDGKTCFHEYIMVSKDFYVTGTFVKSYNPVDMLAHWKADEAKLSAVAKRFLERAAEKAARKKGW